MGLRQITAPRWSDVQLTVAIDQEPTLLAPSSNFGNGALEQAAIVCDRDYDLTTRCVHNSLTWLPRVLTAAIISRVTERERARSAIP